LFFGAQRLIEDPTKSFVVIMKDGKILDLQELFVKTYRVEIAMAAARSDSKTSVRPMRIANDNSPVTSPANEIAALHLMLDRHGIPRDHAGQELSPCRGACKNSPSWRPQAR
jgi:hypothetical protein